MPRVENPPKLTYRPSEVQKALGISRPTFYRLVERGEIQMKRISERVSVVTAGELQRYVAGLPNAQRRPVGA